MTGTYEDSTFIRRYWVWLLLAPILLIVTLEVLHTWLNWSIMQSLYEKKAGLDWFGITFYHNQTFIVAAILALLVINPLRGHSDLYEVWETIKWLSRIGREPTPAEIPVFSPRTRRTFWAVWQVFKWLLAFSVISSINGIPFLGKVTPIFSMALEGIGSWSLVPRVFVLPIIPASSSELISLMPTIEVQYRLVYMVSTAILAVVVARMCLKLIKHFLRESQNVWVRDLFVILACIMTAIILGAPYWVMDITTPFNYLICVVLLASFLFAALFSHFIGFGGGLPFAKRKRTVILSIAMALIAVLITNAVIVAGFRLNWNNNWLEYEWNPLTRKQIAVTRWAAGIDHIRRLPLSALPEGNVTETLMKVRQWDSRAAYTRMINRIGSNWMTLADSDIIYVGGREYWVAPTTVCYPSMDWISVHLIYTHTSRIIVIDSHSGEYVNLTDVFGIPEEPPIYYGEGFENPVYVGVKGFSEVENASYPGEPDYVLSGWRRTLWFLLQGQLGFAFSPPQDEIKMLYNRDVVKRVSDILIYGLKIDPDVYLVSDGERLYYAVQVYIDYPMHSGFAASRYLRYFAVVLVDVVDGSMKGYIVGKPDGFLVDFYTRYYSEWKPITDPTAEWLRPQLRYPEALLGKPDQPGQLDVDFMFHVDDPFTWRSGSKFYERPPGTEVLYVLFVENNQTHFVGIQVVEYKMSESKNLAAVYLAYGGERLGEIVLYEAPPEAQLLGPTSAVESLKANQEVQVKLNLYGYPETSSLGNILLYPIGGKLYYFIPLYVKGAVMVTMPQIGIVDASSGSLVAMGSDASEAYYNLIGATVETGAQRRLERLKTFFTEAGYDLLEVWAIHPDVEVLEENLTYLSESQWSEVESALEAFLERHPPENGKVFMWSGEEGNVNFGVLTVESNGVKYLYFITVKYR